MSSYRRRLAALVNKLICGVDLSKQPDDELWYITTDGQKTDNSDINLMGDWNRQEGLQVISHTYKDGIGKVRYNAPLVKLGESAFRLTTNTLLVSLPRTLEHFGAGCFGITLEHSVGYLVLLRESEVTFNKDETWKPKIRHYLYVQPNCTQFYNNLGYNIIEKKL